MNSEISELISSLYQSFETKDNIREQLLQFNRQLTLASGKAIQAIQRDDMGSVKRWLSEAKTMLVNIMGLLEKYPWFLGWGGVHSGIEEYCEAEILYAIVTNTSIPTPKELGVPEELFLLGIGDVPGELRRILLRDLAKGETDRPKRLVDLISEIYSSMMQMEFSKGLISNLRKKIDRIRYILEQSESDYTRAVLTLNLESKLDQYSGE